MSIPTRVYLDLLPDPLHLNAVPPEYDHTPPVMFAREVQAYAQAALEDIELDDDDHSYMKVCPYRPPVFAWCSGDGTECWNKMEITASCWSTVVVQLVIGVIFFGYAALVIRGKGVIRGLVNLRRAELRRRRAALADVAEATCGSVTWKPGGPVPGSHAEFTSFVRREDNFVRSNLDPQLEPPPSYGPEYVHATLRLGFLSMLKEVCMDQTFIYSC